MIDSLYPISPAVNAAEITTISAVYRKQVVKVMLSILLFIVSYIAVLVGSVAFVALCLFLAGLFLSFVRHWIGFLLLLGVIVMGGMLLFFLLKFLFQKKPEDNSERIELHKDDAPLLFDFIEKLCAEVGTELPKKVVITPAVNAGVYYDLSFLSLLLPARKNLEIGAGLLNSINMSEFKAVLAHEFGHFSQSSTKLGSYVYRVRLVLYNLIYQNDGWLNALQGAANMHSVISFFAQATWWIAKRIMDLFGSIFKVVDLNYMALSRQMEFHADAVAVSVTGSQSIISGLHRITIGEEVFQTTVTQIRSFDKERTVIPENFFELHSFNLKEYATAHGMVCENGLPVIKNDDAEEAEIKGRLQFEDVFATHPSISERKKNAESFNVPSVDDPESPWLLFSKARYLQMELSKMLGAIQVSGTEAISAGNAEILAKARKIAEENQLHPTIAAYFQLASNLESVPIITSEAKDQAQKLTSEDLFGKAVRNRIKRYYVMMQEEQTMLSISSGHLPVKKFLFDDKPTSRYYSGEIYEQIKTDNEQELEWVKTHNQIISNWFYFSLYSKDARLADNYHGYMSFFREFSNDIAEGIKIRLELETFYFEHIQRYRDIEDIPYQRKKIIELFEKWEKWRATIPDREIMPDLKPLLGERYQQYFTSVTGESPAESEQLGGLEDFHKNMVEQLNLLLAKKGEVETWLMKKQNDFFYKIEMDREGGT